MLNMCMNKCDIAKCMHEEIELVVTDFASVCVPLRKMNMQNTKFNDRKAEYRI